MDVIIRLVIRLLEEFFTQNSGQDRQSSQARAQPRTAAQQQATPASGQAANPNLLSRVLQEIEQLPPHAAQNQAAVPPVPPPIPVVTQRSETMAEHLAELSRRDQSREREMEDRLHLEHESGESKTTRSFSLPGRNPLEQLMLANVILGPCKAREKDPRFPL